MKTYKHKVDWFLLIIPTLIILAASFLFITKPLKSSIVMSNFRNYLNTQFSYVYILVGIFFFASTIYTAFSKIGQIKLGGKTESVQYSNLHWGALIFTSTMSADIIFYSLGEWMMYVREPFIRGKNNIMEWSLTYSLFHWGPIAWSFYLMLSVAFGYMLFVRNSKRQRFSEACRPLMGNKIDGGLGEVIDLIAILALISGTATTFSMSMPLLSNAISKIFSINNSKFISILLLLLVVCVYLVGSVVGMRAITRISQICYILFILFLVYILLFGNSFNFILNSGVQAIGNLTQNFVGMSTAIQTHNFTQNWTIYYWSYWIVWCVATPFFIASISKGRTIKDIILRGYAWGLGGTYSAFIILGGFGMEKQIHNSVNSIKMLSHGVSYYDVILRIMETLPHYKIALTLMALVMIGLYSTVFDSITMVISKYSYHYLSLAQNPSKILRGFWAIMFIILPMALLDNKSSVYNIQSLAIIVAFPTMIVMILIIFSFYTECRGKFRNEK